MPSFKTLKEAEQYGVKNYFEPEIKKIKLTNDEIRYNVFDMWDVRNGK